MKRDIILELENALRTDRARGSAHTPLHRQQSPGGFHQRSYCRMVPFWFNCAVFLNEMLCRCRYKSESLTIFLPQLSIIWRHQKLLYLFPTRLHIHQRMNANGNWHQMIYFPETIIQWDIILLMDMLHYCCTMHNDTHSVHNRYSKPWWSLLPCPQSSCYVFSPPLSGLNWCSLSPFGGPGPHTPKMPSPLLGSAHTPSSWFRTILSF
jgi:hypothetical protein